MDEELLEAAMMAEAQSTFEFFQSNHMCPAVNDTWEDLDNEMKIKWVELLNAGDKAWWDNMLGTENDES